MRGLFYRHSSGLELLAVLCDAALCGVVDA
jgi:hypothetical protein